MPQPPNTAYDVLPNLHPVLDRVRSGAEGAPTGETNVDERRFRPNFYISGADAHGEDDWVGQDVAVGADAGTVRVVMRDSRCVMTTHNPESGEQSTWTR